MKPPQSVKVGPHRYKVVVVPDGLLENAGADGLCIPRRLTIALDGGQPPSQMADALCHELTHVLLDAVRIDDDLEESIALMFGPTLLALIRDNPTLVSYLQEAR